MKKSLIITSWCLAILMLVACSSTHDIDNIEDNMVIDTASATPTQMKATIIPSATVTHIRVEETNTATSVPPTLSATPQPTATANPTETPTIRANAPSDVVSSNLTEEMATQNLIELLATNNDCKLPCWWGIELGQTEVRSIESIFVPLGFDWYPFYEELDDNTPYVALVLIESEEGIVQSIQVMGGAGEETYDQNEAWRPYAIPEVLAQFGVPDEVYVYYPFRFDPGALQAYRLFMYYPTLGIEIDYLGKATLLNERAGWVEACPNILETDEINLFLFQPGTVADYLEQTLPETSLPLPEQPEGTNLYDLVSWEQATESSMDEFWSLFTDSEEGTVCFEFKTYWTGD